LQRDHRHQKGLNFKCLFCSSYFDCGFVVFDSIVGLMMPTGFAILDVFAVSNDDDGG
jgi:hypothetical protein